MRFSLCLIALAILEHGDVFSKEPRLSILLGIIGCVLGFMDVIEFVKNIKII